MQPEMEKTLVKKKTIRPERVLALGFFILIVVGTALLCLPAASVSGKSCGWMNALFTSTSAVCVTGLVAVDTGSSWSLFGKTVLMVLIQAGGLGFMIFATLVMAALGRRISLRNRVLIRESMNVSTLGGLVRLSGLYGALALGIEMTGACMLALRFVPQYGWGTGLFYSLFHAVSAFCNAGFDLFGQYASLTAFTDDPLVLLTISMLIILGGIGFSVMFECTASVAEKRRLSLHSKLVLLASGILLGAGTLVYAVLEWQNPGTLGSMTPGEKLLNAFFQSVTMRTAGFNTVSLIDMQPASKLFSALLMFVGASPASTGGGVKTTTLLVLLLAVRAVSRGDQDIVCMGKQLPWDTVRRALAVVMISLFILLGSLTVLTVLEPEQDFLDLLMEAASAFATVGVSSLGTPNLHLSSKILLIPMMFFGRVGPLTLAVAMAGKQNGEKKHIRYPEEKLMIG